MTVCQWRLERGFSAFSGEEAWRRLVRRTKK